MHNLSGPLIYYLLPMTYYLVLLLILWRIASALTRIARRLERNEGWETPSPPSGNVPGRRDPQDFE
ncbi:MAG: hypothetical protein AB7I30_02605 [Isosphaeraceae bacterium]